MPLHVAMKSIVILIILICCCSSHFYVNGALNPCTKIQAKSCGECISIPGCAWCEEPNYSTNSHVIIPRCDLPAQLFVKQCPSSSIYFPKSIVTNGDGFKHGRSGSRLATQLKPEVINIQLKAGDAVNVDLTFHQNEDYPVDMYYLLDVSSSMKDDLETLRNISQQLGQTMQKIAPNFRLGLGTFVDKPVKPFVSPDPAYIANPCVRSPSRICAPAYSFRNELSLTSRIEAFTESLMDTKNSSNVDYPEGSFDAMMQAIVCQDGIKWREQSYRLLVLSTDAIFHYAGDGKLAGIVLPNDGNCYLNGIGEYVKATEMDYPSIGHLVKKISEHNIHPIFAVPLSIAKTYQGLQKMIPGSVVGILEHGSVNIKQLIENAYKELKKNVLLELSSSADLKITNMQSHCKGGIVDGLQCNNLESGDKVNFTFTLSAEDDFSGPASIRVSPYGYNDAVTVNVNPLKKCTCSEDDDPDSCSGHGKYECGACLCDSGFIGLDCSCDLNDKTKNSAYYQEYCRDPVSGVLCNDNGECHCGNCICNRQQSLQTVGKFCRNETKNCARVNGNVCNGKGTCQGETCVCDKGWTGSSCDCTVNHKTCSEKIDGSHNDTLECNGNGVCKCGVCHCNETQFGAKYRGQLCDWQPILECSVLKDCIQCKAFGKGRYNNSDVCQDRCKNYNVTRGYNDPNQIETTCRFSEIDCLFEVYYKEVEGFILAKVPPQQDCNPLKNNWTLIIVMISFSILYVLAPFLVYCFGKIYTSTQDRKHLMKLIKETQSVDQQEEEFPSQEYLYTIRYLENDF